MPLAQTVINSFNAILDAVEATRTGRWTLGSLARLSTLTFEEVMLVPTHRQKRDAARAIAWAKLLPPEVATATDPPLLDFPALPRSEAEVAYVKTLQALDVMTNALLVTGPATTILTGEAAARLIFGKDPISRRLRDRLARPVEEPLPSPTTFPPCLPTS